MISTISRDELKKKIDRRDNFLLLETLEPVNYESAHLPGAINLSPSRLQELASRIAPNKSQEIVVYCASPHMTRIRKRRQSLGGNGLHER